MMIMTIIYYTNHNYYDEYYDYDHIGSICNVHRFGGTVTCCGFDIGFRGFDIGFCCHLESSSNTGLYLESALVKQRFGELLKWHTPLEI